MRNTMEIHVESLSREVMPIPEQAKMILVRDEESKTRANDFFLIIKGLRKKIGETFDPIIAAAHKAHREALNKKAECEAPLIQGEKWLNGQITAYALEQERQRQEEEEQLHRIALEKEMRRRKEEEARRLAEAAALEAAGAEEEAEQMMEEALRKVAAPVIIEPPPPSIPKVELQGAAIRETWSAEVVDLAALVKAIASGRASISFVEANMTALHGQARSLKGNMNIPGVRAVSKKSMVGTGRW